MDSNINDYSSSTTITYNFQINQNFSNNCHASRVSCNCFLALFHWLPNFLVSKFLREVNCGKHMSVTSYFVCVHDMYIDTFVVDWNRVIVLAMRR